MRRRHLSPRTSEPVPKRNLMDTQQELPPVSSIPDIRTKDAESDSLVEPPAVTGADTKSASSISTRSASLSWKSYALAFAGVSILTIMFATRLTEGFTKASSVLSRPLVSGAILASAPPASPVAAASTTSAPLWAGTVDIPSFDDSTAHTIEPSVSVSPPAARADDGGFRLKSRQIPTGYRIVRTYEHDRRAFTQGMQWLDGTMYESYGLYGQSGVRKLKYHAVEGTTGMGTFQVLTDKRVDHRFFAEGLAVLNDRVFQITWKEKTCLVYDTNYLNELYRFDYSTTISGDRSNEGWGLTHDGTHLIVSDGTNYLIDWRVTDSGYEEIKRREVHDYTVPPPSVAGGRRTQGQPKLWSINELEYVHGWVFANVWYNKFIYIIDPDSGDAVGKLDMRPLADQIEGDVLNGIAYTMYQGPGSEYPMGDDAWSGRLWVTGKQWNKMFELELTDLIDAPPTREVPAAAARRVKKTSPTV
jgi:glutamine cyclotransferase